MPAQLGKISVAPGGAQLIVNKGAPGAHSEGDTALVVEDPWPLPSRD